MTHPRTFVGFGFGAIQAGLFLYEAHRSRAFDRLVAAEILPEVVDAVRRNGNAFTVNVAHRDGVVAERVENVELLNPNDARDRAVLLSALAHSPEMATALPSVNFYTMGGDASVARLLAEAAALKLQGDLCPAVVYAAENHNHAAEILATAVGDIEPEACSCMAMLNTVIGKMSGVVTIDASAQARGLQPIAPGLDRAFLVEAFNHILVSTPDRRTHAFERGLDVFYEKPDLLPFEEAKLYGHNAIHVMGGCLASLLGMQTFDELSHRPDLVAMLRAAFVDECGAALVARYSGVDPLFTSEGFAAYADDLLERMLNPRLADTVSRVIRDLPRKLGWDDRLIGTVRLILGQGIEARHFSVGVAAALAVQDPTVLQHLGAGTDWLRNQFPQEVRDSPEAERILSEVSAAFPFLLDSLKIS